MTIHITADICARVGVIALTILAVSAVVDKCTFTNNWRVVPSKLTDAMIPADAKPTAGKLKLNKHQLAEVRKSLGLTDEKDITNTVLKAAQLKSLHLVPRQLDLIGLKSDDQRKAADIKDEKALKILRVDEKELGKVVVKELELVIFPGKTPPHYGIIVTPVSDFLPKIFTDYGDGEDPKSAYRFITLGKEERRVVAHVTKIIPLEKTIYDFDIRTERFGIMDDKFGEWNCLSYAGQWLLYGLGQCGLTKADIAALKVKPKPTDEVKLQGDCKKRSNKDAADFMKAQKTSGLFDVGDGWRVYDFAHRVGEKGDDNHLPHGGLDPDLHFDFSAQPCTPK